MVKFYTDTLGKLPYDPWTTHPIPLGDLLACARAEGVAFRAGDVLLIRAGFMVRFYGAAQEERDALRGRPETLCVACPPRCAALRGSRADADACAFLPAARGIARASSRARR